MIVNRGEEEYLGRRSRSRGGGTSMTKTLQMGIRSVPKVLKNCPINYSLVFFVLDMIRNEFRL